MQCKEQKLNDQINVVNAVGFGLIFVFHCINRGATFIISSFQKIMMLSPPSFELANLKPPKRSPPSICLFRNVKCKGSKFEVFGLAN